MLVYIRTIYKTFIDNALLLRVRVVKQYVFIRIDVIQVAISQNSQIKSPLTARFYEIYWVSGESVATRIYNMISVL